MLARCLEQAGQEGGGAAHLRFHVDALQVEDHRGPVRPHPRGKAFDLRETVLGRVDRDVAERLA